MTCNLFSAIGFPLCGSGRLTCTKIEDSTKGGTVNKTIQKHRIYKKDNKEIKQTGHKKMLMFCWPCILLWLPSQPAHRTVTYREYYTRCCINSIWPPDDEQSCSKHVEDYGPVSSFGIATDYGLDSPRSNPGGDEIFCPSKTALGPNQPPVKWVTRLSRG